MASKQCPVCRKELGFLTPKDMMSKAFSEQQNTQIKRRSRKEDVSIADEIKKYKDLLDSGAITKEEYDDLKGRLLNGY